MSLLPMPDPSKPTHMIPERRGPVPLNRRALAVAVEPDPHPHRCISDPANRLPAPNDESVELTVQQHCLGEGPMLRLTVEHDGTEYVERIDLAELRERWAESLMKDLPLILKNKAENESDE